MSPDKVKRYLEGECYRLAMEVSRLTGWPMVVLDLDPDYPDDRDGGPPGLAHVMVRMPDGRLLDAEGPHADYDNVAGLVYGPRSTWTAGSRWTASSAARTGSASSGCTAGLMRERRRTPPRCCARRGRRCPVAEPAQAITHP